MLKSELSHPTHTPRSHSKPSKNVNLLTQHLKVLHQRVALDVDLSKNKVEGFTEITIVPTINMRKTIKFDCREMSITGVLVNGKKANFVYQDLLHINSSSDIGEDDGVDDRRQSKINLFDLYSDSLDIHQHHLLKQKLSYIFGELNFDPREPPRELANGNSEELTVILPDSFKLELIDANNQNLHSTPGMPGTANAAAFTPLAMRTKNTFSQDTYAPVTIKVTYSLVNPKNGIAFVNQNQDKKLWHAYTTNSEYGVSTSSWVPCIDNLWERNTWSLELSIPRTVKDVGFPRIIGTKEAIRSKSPQKRKRQQDRRGLNYDDVDENDSRRDDEEEEEEEVDDDDEEEEEENLDLVVCTGDFNNIKETPHPIDLSKKVVMWSVFNPICAHHVGWAVGCFQTVSIPSSKQDEENEKEEFEGDGDDLEKENGDIPLTVYCLPNSSNDALNSCIFLNKAKDFFLKEFGSFPFSLYAMVFVENSTAKTHDFAGLSVCSDKLLYPENLIEPMLLSTETLLECLTVQWSGINVVPQTPNDLWCTTGIASYMALQFIRVLMGNNEYRFKIKTKMNEIVETDIGRSPLALQFFRFPISILDLQFLRLKSPVVLFILDKRMTKTDKSFGLSRVLPKIFLQAMSGDLPNGTLSTQHFQYVCEKVNRNKLDQFFKQWVFGAGVPIFNISQKFNKKRSLIEMSIRQVQQQETKQLHPRSDTFIGDSVGYLEDEPSFMIQPVFSGPMTIRIHEADGVPYEHIVDLKEGNVKLDIQYNTKFKRMKRNREEANEKSNGTSNATKGEGAPAANQTPKEIAPPAPSTFSQLGDILQSPQEMEEWGFSEWSKRDEDDIYNDAFEWIRVDADFEWIAKINVQQPDYMFGSQLQYDRDVEAQYEAIRYFGDREKPTTTYCTVLSRTVMDTRYYYGIRIAAAKALADVSKAENNYIGVRYLIKIFKKLYCFAGSLIPLSNDFNDFNAFFLQRAIPQMLCNVRDEEGKVTYLIKNLLLNLVKFNDNSNNDFQDCFYVCDLLSSLTTSLLSPASLGKLPGQQQSTNNQETKFLKEVVTEINCIQKLDEWIPSYQSIVSVCCLRQRIRLAVYGLVEFLFEDLLYYTLEKYPYDVRVEAFRGLLILGGLKTKSVLQYFLKTALIGANVPYFRNKLIEIFRESICIAAIHGTPSTLDDPEFNSLEKLLENASGAGSASGPGNTTTTVVVEDGGPNTEISSRRDAFARATLSGAIELLRRDYAIGLGLRQILWDLLHTSLLSIYERRNIFTLCQILYREIDSFKLLIPIPSVSFEELKKKFVLRNLGSGKIVIRREGRNKIQLPNRKTEEQKSTSLRVRLPPLAAPSTAAVPPTKGTGATATSTSTSADVAGVPISTASSSPTRTSSGATVVSSSSPTKATTSEPKLKVKIKPLSKPPSSGTSKNTIEGIEKRENRDDHLKPSKNSRSSKAPLVSPIELIKKEKVVSGESKVTFDPHNRNKVTIKLPKIKLHLVKKQKKLSIFDFPSDSPVKSEVVPKSTIERKSGIFSSNNLNSRHSSPSRSTTSTNGITTTTATAPSTRPPLPPPPPPPHPAKQINKPLVKINGSKVTISIKRRSPRPQVKNPRYVKIYLDTKKVEISATPFN